MAISPREAMEKLAVKPPPKFDVGDSVSLGSTQFYTIEDRRYKKPTKGNTESGWSYRIEGYGGYWQEEKLVSAQGELFPKPKPSKIKLPKQSQPIPVTTEPLFFVGETVKSNATGILYIVTNKDWSPTFKEWVYQLNDFKGKATEWPIRERFLMKAYLSPETQASRTASIVT